jgi:hypothetical protein
VSEPSYRINTERRPALGGAVWEARVCRVSDGFKCATLQGYTEQAALARALEYVEYANDPTKWSGGVYFAHEDGTLDPATPAPEVGAA